jgi:protein-S-isoprenylcysteine O-methyltransferase Ste14
MTLDHLAFSVGFTVYIMIGVYFEERALLSQWGPIYEAYCRRVGSIVPSLSQ